MKLFSVQNSLNPSAGGGSIAQIQILKSNFKDYEQFNFEITPDLNKNKIYRYLFSFSLFFSLIKSYKRFKPDLIVVGQIYSLLTIFIFFLYTYRKRKIQIVHTAENICLNSLLTKKNTNICGGKIGSKCIKNKCYNAKTGVFRIVIMKFYNLLLNHFIDEFYVLSEYMRLKLIESKFKPVTRINLNYNDISSLKEQSNINLNKRTDKRILFIGTLEWNKGIKETLDAFIELLKTKKINNSTKLIVVGEGSLKSELINKVEESGVIKNVIFSGLMSRENVYKEYEKASLIVFCSYFETYGLVAREAISFNKKIIVSNRGALPELISNYSKALIVNDINSVEISNNILRLI